MRLPFLHPGPPSGDDHDGLSGGPCASTRLLVGGILWFCLCLGLSLCLASREGGAVLVAEDGQPVLATGDWLRHRDRLDDLMRQTLSRVMPGCRLLTMPGFSEQEARHYRVEGDGAPLRLALALQERFLQTAQQFVKIFDLGNEGIYRRFQLGFIACTLLFGGIFRIAFPSVLSRHDDG